MVGAREYDPEIGRFLQPDPQPTGPDLQWGQLNRWAYCANDPINASDPSGRSFQSAFGVLSILLGIGIITFAVSSAWTLFTNPFALASWVTSAFAGPGRFLGAALAAVIFGLGLILQGLAWILEDVRETCAALELERLAGLAFAMAGAITAGMATGNSFAFLTGMGGILGGYARMMKGRW